jgi:hypothetical protein
VDFVEWNLLQLKYKKMVYNYGFWRNVACPVWIGKLTLYDPKSCTTHVKIASRPTANVTFGIGELNFGSAEKCKYIEKRKYLSLKTPSSG